MKITRSTSSSDRSSDIGHTAGSNGWMNSIVSSAEKQLHAADPANHYRLKQPPFSQPMPLTNANKSSALSTGASSTRMTKVVRMSPVKRRPLKKRMRPEAPVHYQQRQVVSPVQDKRKITMHLPETLQNSLAKSGNMMGRQVAHHMEFLQEEGRVPGANEYGSIDSIMATSVVADDGPIDTDPVLMTPPQLQRQLPSIFPRTDGHKAVLNKEIATRKAAVHHTLFEITAAAANESRPQDLFQGLDIGKTIKACKTHESMNDEENLGDWSDTTRPEEIAFFAAACTLERSSEFSCSIPMPPKLAKSGSETICSMMNKLLEGAPAYKETEHGRTLVNTKQQLSGLPFTPPRKSFSMHDERIYSSSEDLMMNEAVATMQQPIIQTPKRMLRRKKSSFSSFASSASGSSVSSCVTPSPKRMMGSSCSSQLGEKAFGQRFSHSMGSLNGFSGSVPQAGAKKLLEAADILDRARGFEEIRKSEELTEKEKVEQARMMLMDPLDTVEKQSHRRNSLQSGSKQSLLNADLLNHRKAPSFGKAQTSVAKKVDYGSANHRLSSFHRHHRQQKIDSNDILTIPTLPMHRDSKTGASLVPRPWAAKTWTQAQEEMFNPYTFNSDEGDRGSPAESRPEKSSGSAPRRVSHF